jgi:geranylgeranyl diphosphate synthase type I
MNATTKLKQYKDNIEPILDSFFNDKIAKAKDIDLSSSEMIELLKEFTLRGGKRIRAAYLYYGYKCFKNNKEKEIMKASLAVELIHPFLLIHDDIIDQDDKRRKGPTIHKAYEQIFQNNKDIDPEHYGKSFAIIAGDILYAFANEILTKININNHAVHNVIYGEALDILSAIKTNFNKQDLEKTHYLKTASYTIEAPLQIGAILAGASEQQLSMLSKYSIPLGKAFQLQDDILGLFGKEEELGKPIGSDLKQGKRTLLILKALETAEEDDKAFILSTLNNQLITKEDINRVKNIVIKTNSLKYSQDTAKKLIQQAKAAITKQNLKPEGKEFLLGIADYMLERNL